MDVGGRTAWKKNVALQYRSCCLRTKTGRYFCVPLTFNAHSRAAGGRAVCGRMHCFDNNMKTQIRDEHACISAGEDGCLNGFALPLPTQRPHGAPPLKGEQLSSSSPRSKTCLCRFICESKSFIVLTKMMCVEMSYLPGTDALFRSEAELLHICPY